MTHFQGSIFKLTVKSKSGGGSGGGTNDAFSNFNFQDCVILIFPYTFYATA